MLLAVGVDRQVWPSVKFMILILKSGRQLLPSKQVKLREIWSGY